MASAPPRRTDPQGLTIRARQKTTKILAAQRKNQSNELVSAGLSQPKKSAACCGAISAKATNSTTSAAEIAKTGLWISSPNGPICAWKLS